MKLDKKRSPIRWVEQDKTSNKSTVDILTSLLVDKKI